MRPSQCPFPAPGHSRHFVALLVLLSAGVRAQSNANKTKPEDFFWQLQGLDGAAPIGNPYLGGQNFTYCCLKAVNQSLDVRDNKLFLLNDTISTDAEGLIAAADRGQFPCGAVYNDDPRGAPVVRVNYTWLAEECPGWERSGQKNLNAWLQPLSGFLLPAIIFCLSVPRRRKLHIFRAFFVADLAGVKSYLPALLGAVGALVLVTLDTIIWLCTCFAFAGPMILSGLYEALLDNRILDFLRVKIVNERLTLDMRCRLLMMILIGNLDLALDESEDGDDCPPARHFTEQTGFLAAETQMPRGSVVLEPIQHGSIDSLMSEEPLEAASLGRNSPGLHSTRSHERHRSGTTEFRREFTAVQRRPTMHLRASPWRHMEELLYGIRLFDDQDTARHLSPRQWPRHDCEPQCRIKDHVERPLSRTLKTERQIRKTKTRLRTMLHCQYSFGSVVGAPVVFFLGGFIFALLQSLEGLGDEDIAEGLAFGQWYMTIPHIAIVSGLLLAGNNPNILEGVFATEREVPDDDIKILGLSFELAYPSCYKVAWQWLRGHTKKKWINELVKTYQDRYDFEYTGRVDRDSDIEQLRIATTLSPLDWFLILSLTTLLLGIPFILAFLTAFYTPEVGLSCRSLTITIYFCLEFTQILLWLWAYAGPPPANRDGEKQLLNFFRRHGWLDGKGFYRPTSTYWLLGPSRTRTFGYVWRRAKEQPMHATWCCLWYFFTVLFGLLAIFTALGGTLMQLMGVYSADMCYVTVQDWTRPFEERQMPVISTNSAEMIEKASKFWEPCAITAIVFMTVVSFVGWWYQRRMRDMFTRVIADIDRPEFDSQFAKEARPIPFDAPSLLVTSEPGYGISEADAS